MTGLTVALAAVASLLSYLCGRHSGWLQGFRDCQGRGLYDKGYEAGWRSHQQFINRGGQELAPAPKK